VAHNQLYPVNILHVNPSAPQVKVIDLDEAGTTPFKDMEKYMRHGDYRGCYVAPEIIKGDWHIKNDEWSVGVIMYYFLTGDVPFWGYDFRDVFSKTLAYQFDTSSYAFNQISDEGRDLLLKLMAFKADDRISAADALKHPWFKLGDALAAMKRFHAGSKLKQAVQAYFTQNLLSQAELTQLADQFRQFDKNGNGVLSRDELIEGFRSTKGI
jgi:calcium-dependent protein kinase